jgi:Zn-dependent protease with chaperone function
MPELRIREVGFGRQIGYELAWDQADGTRAVHVMDAAAVSALLAAPSLAKSVQMHTLQAAQRRRVVGRSLGWIFIGALVSVPVILILLFIWQADRIAGALVNRVPIAQEIEMGKDAFADLQSSLSLEDRGPAFDAVREIGKRLSQGSNYPFEFHVARDTAINAFALPGGIVVVNSGLIAATHRPEELAGVLAHEIQHVEQRHSLRAAFKQLGLRGMSTLVTGDVASSVLSQAALQLTSLQFSRADEADADAKGFESLVRHDIDPQGMIDFFATMEKQAGPKPPAFLSTHPADHDRQAVLAEKISGLGRHDYLPLQFGQWPPAAN